MPLLKKVLILRVKFRAPKLVLHDHLGLLNPRTIIAIIKINKTGRNKVNIITRRLKLHAFNLIYLYIFMGIWQ